MVLGKNQREEEREEKGKGKGLLGFYDDGFGVIEGACLLF